MLRASVDRGGGLHVRAAVTAHVPDCGDHWEASANWSENSVSPLSLEVTVTLS